MARPREFEEAAVLDHVVRQFWSRGYTATSIRDLEAATGVGIASLYNAFGGKRALFLAALQRYSEQRTRACIREIEQIASPAARIRTFVTRVTEAALRDSDRLGCLVVNTAMELGPHDAEVAAIVAGHLSEVEDFFRRSFDAALSAGEADPKVSPGCCTIVQRADVRPAGSRAKPAGPHDDGRRCPAVAGSAHGRRRTPGVGNQLKRKQ